MDILPTGTRIHKYKIARHIRRGRQADVYEVRDPAGRRLALKLLRRDAEVSKPLARLAQEGDVVAWIDDLHIVRLIDEGTFQGRLWIALEYVDGSELREILEAGPLEVERALRLVRQVCEGLVAVHEMHIVHRDLRPENILVASGDFVKITDFGSAKAHGLGLQSTTQQDFTSSLYVAPEVACGGLAGAHSDVYSLGLILYEMLTGKNPMAPGPSTAIEIVNRHLTFIPERLATARPEVPVELSALVERAIAKDPAERCTLAELMDGIAALLHRGGQDLRAVTRSYLEAEKFGPSVAQTAPMPTVGAQGTMPMAAVPHPSPSAVEPVRSAASSAPSIPSSDAASSPALPVLVIPAAPAGAGGRPAALPPPRSPLPVTLRSAPATRPLPPTLAMPQLDLPVERRTTGIPVESSRRPSLDTPSTRRRTTLFWALVGVALGLSGFVAALWWLFPIRIQASVAAPGPAVPPPAPTAVPAPTTTASAPAAPSAARFKTPPRPLPRAR